jgi:hypothetical protein
MLGDKFSIAVLVKCFFNKIIPNKTFQPFVEKKMDNNPNGCENCSNHKESQVNFTKDFAEPKG